jgi:hypothetical protein
LLPSRGSPNNWLARNQIQPKKNYAVFYSQNKKTVFYSQNNFPQNYRFHRLLGDFSHKNSLSYNFRTSIDTINSSFHRLLGDFSHKISLSYNFRTSIDIIIQERVFIDQSKLDTSAEKLIEIIFSKFFETSKSRELSTVGLYDQK